MKTDSVVLHGAAADRPDRPDEADTIAQADHVAAALRRLGYRPEITRVGTDVSSLDQLAARPPAIVFNLVEALAGDGRLIAVPPLKLEQLGLAYTGSSATALAITTDKLATKRILRGAGLPTPAWNRAEFNDDTRVIVKSVHEDASYGIDSNSVVPARWAAGLVRSKRTQFGGEWFVERYIAGREFNVSLLETEHGLRVLPIAEIRFENMPAGRPSIVDYNAKWNPTDPAYRATERIFPAVSGDDQMLIDDLAVLARRSWDLLGLAGYGRIDFRVDGAGRPYILEVNANPCLAPDAGFVAAASRAGLGYDELIADIVAAAKQSRAAKAA